MVKKVINDVSLVQNAEKEENYFGDSSSFCSEEASNYPEEEDFVSNLRVTFERRRRNVSKKYHVVRKPKLSKKKGETKLDRKMRILQRLIPNSSKVDNACLLDEAIVYIKVLQNQLQLILSANAVTTGMYIWRMQTLLQPNMTNQLYASSIVQNNDDIYSSLPASGMFINQHPSLMWNSSSPSFSPYGSLMMPFKK